MHTWRVGGLGSSAWEIACRNRAGQVFALVSSRRYHRVLGRMTTRRSRMAGGAARRAIASRPEV